MLTMPAWACLDPEARHQAWSDPARGESAASALAESNVVVTASGTVVFPPAD